MNTSINDTTVEPAVGSRNPMLAESTKTTFFSILILLAVFGVISNTFTFFVIATSKKLVESPFNIMLMSLCVSDFLSALGSPFEFYRVTNLHTYALPGLCCKISRIVEHWTTIVTVQHILSFVILRFVAMRFPHTMRKFDARKARILVICLWAETFLINASFPLGATKAHTGIYEGEVIRSCEIAASWAIYAVNYVKYGYLLVFCLLTTIMIVLTVYLCGLFLQRRKKRRKLISNIRARARVTKENRALLQLAMTMFSFLLGYIPEMALQFRVIGSLGSNGIFFYRDQQIYTLVALMALHFSECINALCYNAGSSTLRAASIKALKKLIRGTTSGKSSEET